MKKASTSAKTNRIKKMQNLPILTLYQVNSKPSRSSLPAGRGILAEET
jgi:hypothetical protein